MRHVSFNSIAKIFLANYFLTKRNKSKWRPKRNKKILKNKDHPTFHVQIYDRSLSNMPRLVPCPPKPCDHSSYWHAILAIKPRVCGLRHGNKQQDDDRFAQQGQPRRRARRWSPLICGVNNLK